MHALRQEFANYTKQDFLAELVFFCVLNIRGTISLVVRLTELFATYCEVVDTDEKLLISFVEEKHILQDKTTMHSYKCKEGQ